MERIMRFSILDPRSSIFCSRLARWRAGIFLSLCGMILLAACGQNMRDDGRIKPYEPVVGFGSGVSEQPLPAGVVARSQSTDLSLETGKQDGDGAFVSAFPIAVTAQVVQRGKLRYDIYCAPCHGAMGDGQGIIPNFGFDPKPASYLTDTLKQQPVGYLFDVATNGKGVMFGYSSRVPVADRWAIIAYIRALQINAQAPLEVAPEQIEQSGGSVQ
jgi:mono/diheme cytochrome c family protein